jgi:hypothetical protein
MTGRRAVDLATRIAARPLIVPSLTNVRVQINYRDKLLNGTLQQAQTDLLEVNENEIFEFSHLNFQINQNPITTLTVSIQYPSAQVNINSNNFQQQEFDEICRIVEEAFPISQEVQPPQQNQQTVTNVSSNEDKKETENRQIATKEVFVIMSYNDDHRDAYYVAIQPTLLKLGFKPIRVDEIQHNNTVTKEIYEAIDRSAFVVADLTGERPNVYYEVGWSHKAGKEVVLLAKKETAVHFDVAAINRIDYKDYTDLCDGLEKRVRAVAQRLGIDIIDSSAQQSIAKSGG